MLKSSQSSSSEYTIVPETFGTKIFSEVGSDPKLNCSILKITELYLYEDAGIRFEL